MLRSFPVASRKCFFLLCPFFLLGRVGWMRGCCFFFFSAFRPHTHKRTHTVEMRVDGWVITVDTDSRVVTEPIA